MNIKIVRSVKPGNTVLYSASILINSLYSYSFLDDAFRKNLESALRFGNPLLVQVNHLQYLHVQVTCVNVHLCRSITSHCVIDIFAIHNRMLRITILFLILC